MFGVSVDSPHQNGAMIEKLELPFPLLSDPDREALIGPFGVADPHDERNIARPALILLAPGGEEVWRFESRDFADRLPEDDVLEKARELGLSPTTQDRPVVVDPRPGPRAMPLEGLGYYFRGARFAALAMGLRHRHLGEEIAQDSKAYVAEMDRFSEALKELLRRKRS